MKSYGHDDLPESSDKNFWNGENRKLSIQEVPANHGDFINQGGSVVCTRCKDHHTISFDRARFAVKNGELVSILDK